MQWEVIQVGFKIVLGNCLNELKNVSDNSIDLVITDPPYMLSNVGGGLFKNSGRVSMKQIDTMIDGYSDIVLNELCRVLKRINCYIFCSQKQIPLLLDYFTKRNCNWNILCWHKTNPVPTCNNKYLNDTEYCMYFREKGVKLFGSYQTKKTYFVLPVNVKDKKKYNHPTVKPLEIIETFIINSSEQGDIVLDPFAGTGTTAVAALKHDRNYLCYEIIPEYYNICLTRVNEVMI